jgi:putative membrane protein
LFLRESQQGQDPDVKAFATKMLPTLREHLQRARQTKIQ